MKVIKSDALPVLNQTLLKLDKSSREWTLSLIKMRENTFSLNVVDIGLNQTQKVQNTECFPQLGLSTLETQEVFHVWIFQNDTETAPSRGAASLSDAEFMKKRPLLSVQSTCIAFPKPNIHDFGVRSHCKFGLL